MTWLLNNLGRVGELLATHTLLALSAIVAATPSIAEKFPAHTTIVVQNFPEKGLANQRNDKPFQDRTNAFI